MTNICKYMNWKTLQGCNVMYKYDPNWVIRDIEREVEYPDVDYPSVVQLFLNDGLCKFRVNEALGISLALEYTQNKVNFHTGETGIIETFPVASLRIKLFH